MTNGRASVKTPTTKCKECKGRGRFLHSFGVVIFCLFCGGTGKQPGNTGRGKKGKLNQKEKK